MLTAARGVRPRGLLFVSHHPWIALVLVVALVAVVIYLQRRRG